MSKYVDLIGWDDCPHLSPPILPQEERDEFERDLKPHQREARKTGRPALGAGAIFPVAEENFVIDPFPIPEWWGRGYGLDPGWKKTAAAFLAHDLDNDVYYVVGEYYSGENVPAVHAAGIKEMMPFPLRAAFDPAGGSPSQSDGKDVRKEYEALGLELRSAEKSVEAGLMKMLHLLQTGRLKVFNTCVFWLREFRLYRRETRKTDFGERSVVVKENDHLMDATRYALKTKRIFRQAPASILEPDLPHRTGEW